MNVRFQQYWVEKIEKLTGGRYLITLTDGVSFPLYGKELAAFEIQEGELLSSENFQNIMIELLPKRAKLYAMHQLQKMDRTEYQLRKKLMDAHYPSKITELAIEYVKHFHYIDDLRYTIHYLEFHKDTKSMRQMEQELYLKGITKELYQAAVNEIETPDEEEQIKEWIKKKHYDPEQANQKETERIYRFLLRKGYGSSTILHVMRASSLYE